MKVRFEHVDKAFGDKIILRNFSLTLPRSGIVALMGPSGQGKTTLLRLIAGLIKPDSGKVTAEYERLAVVFQEDRLLNNMTARGNIIAALDRGQEAIAQTWLEHMGLSGEEDTLPGEMSGGMRRRLAIARAMAYGGDLVLLDEPFAGLDEVTRAQIYPHIFQRDPSRLTILITHDRQEAERLADRVIVLEGMPLRIVADISSQG